MGPRSSRCAPRTTCREAGRLEGGSVSRHKGRGANSRSSRSARTRTGRQGGMGSRLSRALQVSGRFGAGGRTWGAFGSQALLGSPAAVWRCPARSRAARAATGAEKGTHSRSPSPAGTRGTPRRPAASWRARAPSRSGAFRTTKSGDPGRAYRPISNSPRTCRCRSSRRTGPGTTSQPSPIRRRAWTSLRPRKRRCRMRARARSSVDMSALVRRDRLGSFRIGFPGFRKVGGA